MEMIEKIRQRAKSKLKTIVLPEYEDQRVVAAAKVIEQEGIAKVVVLRPDMVVAKDQEAYAQEFYHLRQAKGMDLETARKTLTDPLFYAAMMTRAGKADGFVAGASHTTPDVARAAIYCLGVDVRLMIACSAFIMLVPDCGYGEKGLFVFSDCGIVPEPNARQLAHIALAASDLMRQVLGIEPKVALLSYSTKGSAKGKGVDKITKALGMVKKLAPDLLVDGELQVDAAIVPEVSRIKYPDSILGGKANVLIFPDLEAGNIGYKLVERLAKARAIGPLLLGLNKPCSDLSRGCSIDDVVDCVAVTSLRAR